MEKFIRRAGSNARSWDPPSSWLRIRTIDAHAAGEPLRVVVSGLPPIPGKTILEKRRYAQEHLDNLRRALMGEPRGHADMYGCIPTEPVTPDGHLGVLFLHNEGFSTMCGHGIIALAVVAAETGLVEIRNGNPLLKIDTPAGRIDAWVQFDAGAVKEVSFLNVPSFAYALDREVEIPGRGILKFDIAFGGAFYAFCQADDLGVRLVPEESRRLVEVGMAVKKAVMSAFPIRHPFEPDLGFLYGTIIIGKPKGATHHSRNVCIFAEGELDRSPTGTGVSARAALHFARGEIKLGESFVVESILGTCFTGRAKSITRFGPYEAVVPEVSGRAYITGRHEFLIDPNDPLGNGFFLR